LLKAVGSNNPFVVLVALIRLKRDHQAIHVHRFRYDAHAIAYFLDTFKNDLVA
jgi:hypothetical protein